MTVEPTLLELVEAKRDGAEHTPAQVARIVDAFTAGEMPDYQMSAWLMAGYLRGLSADETVAMTDAMARSGRVQDLSGIPGVTVDKHSTGGVADSTTLVVAPLAAACGLYVAKMSGRGLGHTGGTLDKLAAIPGYRPVLTPGEFSKQVARVGVAVIAQCPDVDPADRAIYALRDVTGTVPSVPFIVSSIVSKKIAGGAQVVLVDVKSGSGAFMKTRRAALGLARAIMGTGRALGREIDCLITDMDEPLGGAVGNALEVAEAVAVLSGQTHGPLEELSVELVARLLVAAGSSPDLAAARKLARARLNDGSALERFAAWIHAQGGDARIADDPGAVLPAAAVSRRVAAPRSGVLDRVDAEGVGRAALALGAGRATMDADIDPAAGLLLRRRRGDEVSAGDEIATVFAARDALLDEGERRLLDSITIGEEPPEPAPLFAEVELLGQ